MVLTFDDGLICHYNYVLPVLKKRNLWGIFYIPTQPFTINNLLDVHKIHLLLGINSSKIVYDRLKEMISDDMLPDLLKKEFRELTYDDQQNDDYTLLVKRILNYYIGYDHREKIMEQLVSDLIPARFMNPENTYLSEAQISEMHNSGMIIGSHSVSHPVMSKLSARAQYNEIADSFEILNHMNAIGATKTFCYPYGGFHTFTNETEQLLKNEGCLFSFNVETRDVNLDDIMQRPQALPRYDCNYFPFGACR
ncbi:polysaccharide deacetylase family protein [Flavobacterium sp. 3HN19-14]|uniref:polysaccharide deacetylase family protein n=1 Tax=Flavobacterium sp. 3HN19-14 TaxID=3448133 RepID=UPI003EE109E9